jgi:hypothetical protein
MSLYVIAVPEAVAAASEDLTGIAQAIQGAAAAASPSTTKIVTAAGDEVSAAVTMFFGGYAREFQTLTAQAAQFHAQFVRALGAAAGAYASSEIANASTLGTGSSGQPSVGAASSSSGGVGASVTNTVSSAVTNAGSTAVTAPVTNGVTGVRTGFAFLQIPLGEASILGIPLGPLSFPAPAHWYFPTQADGSVHANGVIYLQHGFGAIGWFYDPLAMQMAQQTDSIVVVPTVPSIPLPFGAWLIAPQMQQGVASLFLGSETALNASAHHAGYQGTLPADFILTGHSAGGGLATIAAGDYIADLGGNTANNHLLGVVMFDGVAADPSAFATSIAHLKSLDIPDYVVAAPPQLWNLFGATTNQLVSMYPGQFVGVELVNGSHVDSMLGGNPLVDFAAQLVTQFSPPGNTQAVYTLTSGWINDMYAGAGPTDPIYGIYGPTGGYIPPGGQRIVLGPATGIVLP